jgi:carbon monoxide dehydrogenase subunit G
MLVSLVIGSAWALPGASAKWTVLQDANPHIECTEEGGQPWCRSTGTIDLPIAQVSNTLEHMAEYQKLFKSIVKIDVLAPDTMHIVLDYPWPLTDRDYVAKFSKVVDGDVQSYRWEPVTDGKAPDDGTNVRLVHMAGEWRLEPAGAGTKVTYTWQAEVGGALPEGGYNVARKTAGSEALKDLKNASVASAELTKN